jgi:hypothetical protein
MAVRMALGATRLHVIALVLREGLTLALVGSFIGLIGALMMARAMQSILYGIGALDLPVFIVVLCVLLSAALLACMNASSSCRFSESNASSARRIVVAIRGEQLHLILFMATCAPPQETASPSYFGRLLWVLLGA